jgi:uncharacterized membrane protein YdjX (TVP38/TMEM64 family)
MGREQVKTRSDTPLAMTASLLKPLALVAIVLVVPLVVWAACGETFAPTLARWEEAAPPPTVLAVAVAAILASDLVLPVPSGPISTFAGGRLGPGLAWAACWTGMTCGAVLAFALSRRWGRPLAVRFAGEQGVAAAEEACAEHGSWLLLATRPLPVLAEASALVVGALGLSWRAFLPPVLASNAALAWIYVALGHVAARHGWAPAALCASAAIPLAAGAWWRRRPRVLAAGSPRSAAERREP